MTIDVFGDSIGYVTDEVSTVINLESNLNEENRVKWVTDLASISRGKYESKNPKVRYEHLMKEASITMRDTEVEKELERGISKNSWSRWTNHNGDLCWCIVDEHVKEGRPSRPLEFLPVVFKIYYENDHVYLLDPSIQNLHTEDNQPVVGTLKVDPTFFNNEVAKHSYISHGYLYTNMRTLINSGLNYEYIPYGDLPLYRSFKAIRIKVPMFVFGQLMTHTMISKESQSDRVAESTEYWLPNDFIERLIEYNINHPKIQANISNRNESYDILTADTINAILNLRMYAVGIKNNETTRQEVHDQLVKELLNRYSQNVVQNIFKFLEYKREIWSRAIYYFKYKEMILTGWNNDPKVWEHLLLEREVYPDIHKSWVQEETRKVCEAIAKVIKSKG